MSSRCYTPVAVVMNHKTVPATFPTVYKPYSEESAEATPPGGRRASARCRSSMPARKRKRQNPVRFTQEIGVAVDAFRRLSISISRDDENRQFQGDWGTFSDLDDVQGEFTAGKWIESPWPFKESLRGVLADLGGIQNDAYRDRRDFFFHCAKPVQKGQVGVRKEDGAPRYTKRMRCYDPLCPDCRDYDREKQAKVWTDVTNLIFKHHPGYKKVFRFQLTLPEDIESLFFHFDELEKKVVDGIQAILRKVFGFGYRSNMAIHINIHPCGDSNVLRDRWHAHVYVIPCEISNGVLTWSKVTWIDVKQLQKMWGEFLGRNDVIPPQVSYVDTAKLGWQARLCAKLKYDMRGFGADLEKAAVSTNKGLGMVAIHAPEGVHVVSMNVIAAKYMEIRKRNKIGPRGFLKCLKRYEDVLGFSLDDLEPVEIDPNDVIEVEAEVTLYAKSGYTDRGDRYLHKDEIYTYVCPVSKKVVILARSKMVDVQDYNMNMWEIRKLKRVSHG